MEYTPQEGAGRPLCSSAPEILPPIPKALWLILAASYPMTYLYVKEIFFAPGRSGWWLAAFAALFLAGVDAAARALHRPPARETPLWAGCWLVLSAAMALFGEQSGGLSVWQALVWHLFAVWYVLARCGMLAQGHSGALVPLDAAMGLFALPFGNMHRRIQLLWRGVHSFRRPDRKRLMTTLLTIFLVLTLCGTAWGLLAQADDAFAALGGDALRRLDDLLARLDLDDWLGYFVLSLPVGAWLYGLVYGSLCREQPPWTEKRFDTALTPLRRLPDVTVTAVLVSLCGVYALYFGVQASSFLRAMGQGTGLAAAAASRYAVDGFWALCRVMLLDLAVLLGIRFLSPRPARKGPAALFCGFGIAFALLAGAQLLTYMTLYGLTPRRVLSAWFLCVLLVWAVLVFIRVFRPIPAARIGVVVLAVSFVLLSCLNVDQLVINVSLYRYEAGIDAALDESVLWMCGYRPS